MARRNTEKKLLYSKLMQVLTSPDDFGQILDSDEKTYNDKSVADNCETDNYTEAYSETNDEGFESGLNVTSGSNDTMDYSSDLSQGGATMRQQKSAKRDLWKEAKIGKRNP